MDIGEIGTPALCICGEEFIILVHGQRDCPTCLHAAEQVKNDVPSPHPVESYIELCMEKYGPQFGRLPARDRIALERQIRALGVELCTTERDDSIHNEFRMLLCVAAYRRQVLTPERWARMRRLLYSGGRWLEELRELYAVMMGVPLLEPLSRGKYDILQVDDIEPLLSILDRMVDEPAWMPDREEVIAAQANHQELLKREFAKAPEKMLDRLCLTLYINADSDRQEKMRRLWTQSGYHRLLSLIGYTPEEVTAELEEIEPEQIDADDQGAIDDNANDLLQDIDF